MHAPGSLIARLARFRSNRQRSARLSPTGAAASVALAQATLDGTIENARPFSRDGAAFFRVEAILRPDQVEGMLAFLETSSADPTLET